MIKIYLYILIARAIVSFIPMLRPDWRPPSFLMPVLDVIYALTEPPLQLLRRFVPQPMGIPLDLSFLILIIFVGSILPRIICV